MNNRSFGPKDAREAIDFAVEELRAEIQYGILKAMNEEGLSQAKLARMVGCTPAAISQFLDDNANLTIESIAKLLFALGRKCAVSFPLRDTLPSEKDESTRRVPDVEKRGPKAWLSEKLPKEAWAEPLVNTEALVKALRNRSDNGSVSWGANDNYFSTSHEQVA